MLKIDRYVVVVIILSPLLAFLTKYLFKLDFSPLFSLFLLYAVVWKIYNGVKVTSVSSYTIAFVTFLMGVLASDLYNYQYSAHSNYVVLNLYYLTLITFIYADGVMIVDAFRLKLIKSLSYLVVISLIVVIIQQVYDPNFLIPNEVVEKYEKYNFTSYEVRLASIYAWLGPMSAGLFFPPIVGLIIGEELIKKRYAYVIFLILIALLFSFLTKARWIMIFTLIVSLQIFFNKEIKLKKNLFFVLIIILSSSLLLMIIQSLGIQVFDIIQYRIFEDYRGIENSSVFARIINYEYIFSVLNENLLFGTGSWISESMAYSMGRSDLLIGILNPIFKYGILIGFFYYLAIFLLLRETYYVAKNSNNYSVFLIIVGFIASNFSVNINGFYDMGLVLALMFHQSMKRRVVNEVKSR